MRAGRFTLSVCSAKCHRHIPSMPRWLHQVVERVRSDRYCANQLRARDTRVISHVSGVVLRGRVVTRVGPITCHMLFVSEMHNLMKPNNTLYSLSLLTSFFLWRRQNYALPVQIAGSGFAWPAGLRGTNFPSSFTSWSLASTEFGDSPTLSVSLTRHRGGSKPHEKLIPLKKSSIPTVATTATVLSFHWSILRPLRLLASFSFHLQSR